MKELVIPDWKRGDSVRVYTQLVEPLLPFQPMVEPVLLFGLYYGLDGSLYTEHYVKVSSVLYERVENGKSLISKELTITSDTKLKTSFHGSGEVVGFERTYENWPRAHFGFALRDIDGLKKLASQWIGTAGHYLGQFEPSAPPKTRSVVIPGLFEMVQVPIFNIWASPHGGPTPTGQIAASAITRELKNGKKISIYISLEFLSFDSRPGDPRLVAYIAPSATIPI